MTQDSKVMLSRRALANTTPSDIKAIMSAGTSNLYDPASNPEGMISLGVAENRLMHQEIVDHINSHFEINRRSLTYGDGSVGSDELRQSVADFMNKTAFRPKIRLKREHVTILAGVSSVIDSLAFCLCEAGDGILLGRPAYVGFISDLVNRAAVNPVMVGFRGNQVAPTSLEAVKCYEDSLIESNANGTPVRALLICHPHNPFGTFYAPEVLEAYLSLCAKYNIHFICDEVYANSVFPNSDYPSPDQFTSVLALSVEKFINPSLVHCLYGMSKDFCSNGIRIGAFVSQKNPDLHAAIRAVSKFAWTSSLADSAWCAILRDQEFLTGYFKTLTVKLTKAYEHCTGILRRYKIPYVPSHSGPFVWIDLTNFLAEPDLESEREIAWKMIHNRVWLATGEAYRSEQPGWFRLTFAVDSLELEKGFERLAAALKTTTATRNDAP